MFFHELNKEVSAKFLKEQLSKRLQTHDKPETF